MPNKLLQEPIRITRPQDLPPITVGLNDAARLLGVSPAWLHPRAKAGEIPSAIVGGRRLFRIASLEAWLAERESATAANAAGADAAVVGGSR